MAKELFKQYNPRGKAYIIDQANEIIDEYAAQGFKLTIRQIFYQFVARGWCKNTPNEYKRHSTSIRNCRDGGLIDWDAIEDHTREVNTHASWDDPADVICEAAQYYQEDLWAGQRYRPEVWIEKDALLGVIEDVCTEFRVPYFATRGNTSQTLQYQAGKRFAAYWDLGLIPLVLHLADHDPAGIDMTRDNAERLALYARREVEVRRIALNMDQVQQYNPPPNFAKEGDPRLKRYQRQFRTNRCWELDALSPTVIADLIRAELKPLINRKRWKAAQAKEDQGRERLFAMAKQLAQG
jgi:hypothetical protein